jgi:hypothetical protein
MGREDAAFREPSMRSAIYIPDWRILTNSP